MIHERVHDIHSIDVRNGVLTMRDLPIKSERMMVTGCCDAVEFIKSETGISLNGRDGKWDIHPVEYKHGHSKLSNCDRLQVVAQAMCLEEMFSCEITNGSVFYYETRKRERFEITSNLKENVRLAFSEMHDLIERGYTPKTKKHKGCENCSLKDICLPSLNKGKEVISVKDYLETALKE